MPSATTASLASRAVEVGQVLWGRVPRAALGSGRSAAAALAVASPSATVTSLPE